MSDTLTGLLQKLDERSAEHATLTAYYEGRQPLTFLAPEIRKQLNNRLKTVSINVPRLLVDSITERLRIVGITGAEWDDWTRNDLTSRSRTIHSEALMLGESYAIVWADRYGRPLVTAESATQVACETDPATRQLVRAVKRWEGDGATHAVLYEADQITRYRSKSIGATTTGFTVVERLSNPLGRVPVVRFANGDRLVDRGISEMLDVLPLTDALVKLATDLLTSSEYGARPRRFASGLELVEDEEGNEVSPISEDDRFLISESPDTKWGQLPGSDLSGYENAIGVVMRLISAVTGLPEHLLGVGGDNPTSADSIRASEASLTAKAEARQLTFGRSWTEVVQLMAAVATGRDPDQIEAGVQWADAATRSVAQEADATVKLVGAGVLPVSWALRKLGYTEADIESIEAARAAEAASQAVADVRARVDLASTLQGTQGLSQNASLAAAGLFAAAAENKKEN